MTKALAENWGEFQAAYKTSWKPIEDDIALTGSVAAATDAPPLHAGVVQYYEEKGYKVPAELIPPEYKKK